MIAQTSGIVLRSDTYHVIKSPCGRVVRDRDLPIPTPPNKRCRDPVVVTVAQERPRSVRTHEDQTRKPVDCVANRRAYRQIPPSNYLCNDYLLAAGVERDGRVSDCKSSSDLWKHLSKTYPPIAANQIGRLGEVEAVA